MNESLSVEIRFMSEAEIISPAEVSLLESILPEIIHAMMQAEALNDDE